MPPTTKAAAITDLIPDRSKESAACAEITAQPRVLIADQDRGFAHPFQKALSAAGIATALAGTVAEATALARSSAALYLAFVDSQVPDTGGLALMQQLHHVDPSLTVILMSANGNPAAAVEATQQGAGDYILKPFEYSQVVEKVRRYQELFQRRRDPGDSASLPSGIRSFEDFICSSRVMHEVLNEAKRASRMEVSVLLVGEHGVGKDLLARAIHAASPRRSGPFLRIDCSSFAHDLPDPDLHESAFMDAALQRLCEAAAGGTLFLCEIGDLSQNIQARLVEILDVSRFRKPEGGAPGRPCPRFLASTSRTLAKLQEKYLLKELYSRVADVVLEIPPLRDRPEDGPPLVEYFLGRLHRRYNHEFALSWSGLDLISRYALPGNVRELECILERAAASLLQIPLRVTDGDLRPFLEQSGVPPGKAMPDEHPMELGRIEQMAIERALGSAGGNRTKAAALLGIHRSTLYSKLRRLGKRTEPN